MNIESLVQSYFRHSNRRHMHFPEAPADIGLPSPGADRQYLLYLHIPYCVALCPFCSFHRVEFREDRAKQYFGALRREIRTATDAGYRFSELYVGGGTPTVLPDDLATTIELVRELHPMRCISTETNPDDLGHANLLQLRNAGVSRLSVGVQSFDDDLLREMQRYDKYGSGNEIRNRLRRAAGIFDTLNIDMIFNFPHQSEASLRRDLDILVDSLGVDQVSFYPLMSADTTRKMMLKTVGRVDYSRERDFYRIIAAHMLAAGYTRSSAWCFSRRPGIIDEYIVEHDDYLGLGSGSFSYLDGSLYASTFSINHYLRLVDVGKTGIVSRRDMTVGEQMRYHLLMRLFGGSLDLSAAEIRFAGKFERTLWAELAALRTIGAIRKSADEMLLTERGCRFWVMMMRGFLTGVNNLRAEMRHNIAGESAILPARKEAMSAQ